MAPPFASNGRIAAVTAAVPTTFVAQISFNEPALVAALIASRLG